MEKNCRNKNNSCIHYRFIDRLCNLKDLFFLLHLLFLSIQIKDLIKFDSDEFCYFSIIINKF